MWGVEVRQGYGLSEAGTGAECEERNGFHWCEDHCLVEVVDEEGERVGEGEDGELVYTTISRTGTLAIRFKSNDYSHIIDECSCGRNTIKIAPVTHRIDELVKIRGTLTSPYNIDSMLFSYKNVQNYLCVVEKDKIGTDQMKIFIESDRKDARVTMDLSGKMGGSICVNPNIIKYVPIGSIPSIGSKEKRFVDLRKDNEYNDEVKDFMKVVE
jgi:phenylacetate-CoA ligase